MQESAPEGTMWAVIFSWADDDYKRVDSGAKLCGIFTDMNAAEQCALTCLRDIIAGEDEELFKQCAGITTFRELTAKWSELEREPEYNCYAHNTVTVYEQRPGAQPVIILDDSRTCDSDNDSDNGSNGSDQPIVILDDSSNTSSPVTR